MNRLPSTWLFRFAASAVSLTVCGLLIWLWVRSYWVMDVAFGPLAGPRSIIFESIHGQIKVHSYDDRNVLPWGWESWRWNTRRFGSDNLGAFVLSLPHWFLAFIAGILALAPLVARWRLGVPILASVFTIVSVMWGLIVALAG